MFPTTKNRTPSPECEQWAKTCLTTDYIDIKPLPEHAHHNKFYFTVTVPGNQKQYLLVETHNDMASSLKFSTTAKILRQKNIHTPNVYHQKISQQKSWMIMTHFGNMSMLDWLQQNQNKKQKDILMRHCLDEIGKFQKQKLDYPTHTYHAKTIRSDIERSDTYYLQQFLGIDLNATQKANYAFAKTFLVDQIEKIPLAPMHFDFHSANIMLLPKRTLGILDFQDMQIGPINYDLASLLTDHYYHHPISEIDMYVRMFYDQHLDNAFKATYTEEDFLKMTHWVAIQRHLKNIGIFSKLFFNRKKHYIKHIPGMMHRLRQLCQPYDQLTEIPDLFWSETQQEVFKSQLGLLNQAEQTEINYIDILNHIDTRTTHTFEDTIPMESS